MRIKKEDSFRVQERITELTLKKGSFDAPDVQQLQTDLQKVYPPITPRFAVAQGSIGQPVTMDSPLHMRYLVEFFAESFQQEAQIIFDKPLALQYSAFRRSTEFEAWILALSDPRWDISEQEVTEVQKRECIDATWQALGCCLFYRDDQLSEEQKVQSEWTAAFAWVHPFYRRTGLLKSVWSNFEKYGEFWIEGPVSPEIDNWMKTSNIATSRILNPDRYKVSESDLHADL